MAMLKILPIKDAMFPSLFGAKTLATGVFQWGDREIYIYIYIHMLGCVQL